MSFAAAFPDADTPRPADAHPDAGRHEQPTSGPQPPVGTLPTGPLAEAEAAALQAARSDLAEDEYVPRSLVRFGLVLSADQREIIPAPPPSDRDPGEALRDTDWPTPPPSYSNTSTGRVLARIDDQIGGNLRQRNQTLRAQLRDTTADLVCERSLRRQAELRLAAANARIAELDKTLRLAATLIVLAAEAETEGGE